MTAIRVIPTQPLGHSADCRICAAVDSWVANGNLRLRPATRSGQNDLAGVGTLRSRDDSARSGSPVDPSPLVRRG